MNSFTSLKNKRRVSKFTLKMVCTTVFCCGFMVLVISNLYSQSYNQCYSDLSFTGDISSTMDSSENANLNTSDSLNRCNRDNQQITWLSWLVKQPGSIDFHFLDLIELLSRK